MHPDRATTDAERQRRTVLMAEVNLAYERGDQKAIEKPIAEFGQDPEAGMNSTRATAFLLRGLRCLAEGGNQRRAL
ncbi:MAG: hypothetical protein ACREYA_03695 [Cupriavidus necator]